MNELIVAPAVEVVKCAAIPLARQVYYIYTYSDNLRKLKQQADAMDNRRQRLQQEVEEARMHGDEVFRDVTQWLSYAQKKGGAVEDIIHGEEEAPKRFFFGLLPNLRTRYHFSRMAYKKTMELVHFIREAPKGKLDLQVSYPPPPLVIPDPIPDYIPSPSRSSELEEILEALNDPNIRMIGVYGMPGLGKTTLVRQVAEKVKEKSMFEVAAIVTMKPHPDLNRIRGEIAKHLGLVYKPEVTEEERKERLWKKLLGKRTVLLILDDLWEKFDSHKVGIPFGEYHRGCKLLLVSRRSDVLSASGSQKNIGLGLLNDSEAWKLFEKIVGNSIGKNDDLHSIAREVVKACKGLPLPIVTTAGMLTGKSQLWEWQDAFRRLKNLMFTANGPKNIKEAGMNNEIEKVAYSAIRLSYESLKDRENDELQVFFLLCAMTSNALSVENLIRCAKGWGFLKGIKTMKDARNRVSTLIGCLRNSCLLMESDNIPCSLLETDSGERHSMHDLVRDVGISIASTEQNMFTVRDYELEKWPNEDILKSCTSMFLWKVDFGDQLPEVLNCPQLISFYLHPKRRRLRVPDNFFRRMSGLRVLNLTGMQLDPQLPSSIESLKELHTLCFHECSLENIAIICELTNLEVLSMSMSIIKQLPRELRKLTRLRLLDLNTCYNLKSIPTDAISSLSKLEELYIWESFSQWAEEQNASLSELQDLRQLIALEIVVPNVKILPPKFLSMDLQQYRIFIGNRYGDLRSYNKKASKALEMTGFDTNDAAIKQLGAIKLLEEAEVLSLKELRGVSSICCGLVKDGFSRLKELKIASSPNVRLITEAKKEVPTLEILHLEKLLDLERICYGQCMGHTFQNLRDIYVHNCPKLLESLFSSSRGGSFMKLQHIHVGCCPLQYIVKQEEAMDNNVDNDDSAVIEFLQLHGLVLSDLNMLISFSAQAKKSQENSQRMPLFNKVSFPNLVTLELNLIPSNRIWGVAYRFENLGKLKVAGCCNLRYMLTSSMLRHVMKLHTLDIDGCSALEAILLVDDCEEDKNPNIIFPQLKYLRLGSLPELKRFSIRSSGHLPFVSGGKVVEGKESGRTELVEESPSSLFNEEVSFPLLEGLNLVMLNNLKTIWHNQLAANSFCKLKSLSIMFCSNLESVIPFNMARRLAALEALRFGVCSSLREVFETKERHAERWACGEDVASEELGAVNLSFEKLRRVELTKCPVLKSVFPGSMAKNLRELDINYCRELEGIIARDEDGEREIRSHFPKVEAVHLRFLPKLKCPMTLDGKVISERCRSL